MHSFLLAGAILHATAIAVLGFFVLFAASRAQGLVRTLGHVLGVWLYILAVLAIVCAIVAPMYGDRFGFHMMDPGQQRWMHQWPAPDKAAPPPPATK